MTETVELDDSKWTMIETIIAGQLSRTRRAQRNWTAVLVMFVLGFVGVFVMSFVGDAAASPLMGPGDLLSRAQHFLPIAPVVFMGFHAMKQMSRAENKIDPLEICLVYVKSHNREWKTYWHRANASDEGNGTIMGMLENL